MSSRAADRVSDRSAASCSSSSWPLILETKATKDEILELYLNEVYLGHRGSFALHGVAEAARIFFGKDVSNLSLAKRR